MKSFEYAAPRSLDEAAALVDAHPDALPLAGGTDLLVQLRSGRKSARLVIDVKRIAELNEMRQDSGGLTLGAAVPCYRIYGDGAVSRAYPALAEVTALIGGTQIQGRASLGGNLCNAAPSADAVPILIALGATCRVYSAKSGAREIAVEDFCKGPGRNALAPGELLVSLHVPASPARMGARYLRFIPRNEMDIAVAGAGAAVTLDNGMFRSARIALAAVAPVPLFVREAGEWLAGKPVNHESIETAAEMAKAAAKPITDMRGTAEYRKHLCAVLTRRALESAVERAREAKSA